MEQVKKAPVAKKGSQKTEIIIGAGASKLTSAVTALLGVVSKIEELPATAQQMTLEVVNLEDKIVSLKTQFENEQAQQKIDLKLAYDTDRQTYVDKFLNEKGLTTIESTELNNLKQKAYRTEDDLQQTIRTEKAKAEAIAKADAQNQIKIAGLEFDKREADNTAKINQLQAQNQFLQEQVAMWKSALDSERQAGIERAKASAIGTLNVGANQGR
jgi:hypothetical protein